MIGCLFIVVLFVVCDWLFIFSRLVCRTWLAVSLILTRAHWDGLRMVSMSCWLLQHLMIC